VTPPPGTRTGLAWQRTGLGLIAVAALLGGRAFNAGAPTLLVVAGAAAVIGAGVLGVMAPLRQRMLRRQRAAGEDVAVPGAVAVVTLAVVVFALLAGAAVLMVPVR
jgi:putative membrane protein